MTTLEGRKFSYYKRTFLRNRENQWICCRSRSITGRVIGIWTDDKVKHQRSTLPYQQNMWQNLKSRDFLFHQYFLTSRQSCLFLTFRAIAWVESWARPRFVSTSAIYRCSVDTTIGKLTENLVINITRRYCNNFHIKETF